MPPFIHHGRVAFHETDAAGIVHFSRYFLYAEEAETAALASLGFFTADDLSRYCLPRVQVSAQYSRPLRFPEAYEARASLTHIGNSSLHWHIDIVGRDGGAACVDMVSARRHVADGTAAPYSAAELSALEALRR